jgi:hypothetical protein
MSSSGEASTSKAPSLSYSDKKKHNKSCRTTVVKLGLAHRLKIQALKPAIVKLVDLVSKSQHRAGLILNYVALRAVQEDRPIPDLTNQTFLDNVLTFNEESFEAYPCLREANDRVFHTFPIIEAVKGLGPIALQNARSNYQTIVKNSLVEAFEPRQKRFIRAWCTLNGIDHKKRALLLLRMINGNRVLQEELATLTTEEVSFVSEERILLHQDWNHRARSGTTKITDTWKSKNVNLVVKAYTRWLTLIEGQKWVKRFSILPLSKIRSSHLAIDNKLLYPLMKKVKATDASNNASFDDDIDRWWNKAFDLTKLRDNRFMFAHRIVTDGVSVSIHFQATRTVEEEMSSAAEDKWAKRLAQAEAAKIRKEMQAENVKVAGAFHDIDVTKVRVISIDPGQTNIIFAVEVLRDGSIQVTKLTRGQYYQESGMYAAAKRNDLWNHQVMSQQQSVDAYSMKTVDLDQMEKHIRALGVVYDALWEQRTRPCCARQRLMLWSKKNSVLDATFKKMKRGEDLPIKIAYGDADFAPGGRGKGPVPVKGAAKRCTLYFGKKNVAAVDEHRTSAMSNSTGLPLAKVNIKKESKDGTIKKVEVRGLRLCRSTVSGRQDRPPKLVDRDLNAALNIRLVALSNVRPAFLERGCRVVYGRPITLRKRSRSSCQSPWHVQ